MYNNIPPSCCHHGIPFDSECKQCEANYIFPQPYSITEHKPSRRDQLLQIRAQLKSLINQVESLLQEPS